MRPLRSCVHGMFDGLPTVILLGSGKNNPDPIGI
jgi:hypothetical protein